MVLYVLYCYIFFFKQKTAYEMRISDWSSDVCSSDLERFRSGVAQATGLQGGQANQLLKILAPIVMAYLAKRMFQGNGGQAAGANPDALSGILGQEQQDIRQQGGLGGGLLGAVLDQDGDGQLGLGDLMKIGGGLLGRPEA